MGEGRILGVSRKITKFKVLVTTGYCMTSSQLIKILQSDWSVAMQ